MAKWTVVLLLALFLPWCQVFNPPATPTPTPAPTEEPGEWLTTPLTLEGEQLVWAGPDLTDQVKQDKVYTYYARGVWMGLRRDQFQYKDGKNVWQLTPEVEAAHPDWASNALYSLDFWWPASRGPRPEGAVPGTSSK